MSHDFADITRRFYTSFKDRFCRSLGSRFPSLRYEDVENIYNDAFVAIYENLESGRVKENTNWESYILAIGFNMATKQLRHTLITDSMTVPEGDDNKQSFANKVEAAIKEMPDEDVAFCKNVEVQAILGDELERIPEGCAKLLKLYYQNDIEMSDVAEELGYKNADTAKAKKAQCMKNLIQRVTKSLNDAGFEMTPKKRNRNGKN